jgi:hypothetical protein
MDFVQDVLKLVSVKAAVIIMFLTLFISKVVTKTDKGELPNWFTAIPLAIGLLTGIGEWFINYVPGEIVLTAVKKFALAFQQGLLYGSSAIGLWSARRIIPYFNKVTGEN